MPGRCTRARTALGVAVADPFVRWVGGSQRSLGALRERLPADAARRRYVDPFLGGGALLWALEPRRALVSDACAPLIAAWRALRDAPEELLRELAVLQALRETTDLPSWYRLVTDLLGQDGTDVERGARLIAVNRSCYNGLWRENGSGRFNVALDPASAKRDLVRAELLRGCAAVLGAMDIEVYARSWEATVEAAGAGDLIYADPPYDAEAGVEGHRYTAAGWSRSDLVRLADALAAARDRGAYIISTNNVTTFALDTFTRRAFRCDVVQTTRSVSCDAATRGAVAELIAVGWQEASLLYRTRRTEAHLGRCEDVLRELIAARGAFASLAWIDGPYGMGKGEWDRLTGARHNRTAIADDAIESRVSRYVGLLSDIDPRGADLAAWYAPVLEVISAACLPSATVYLWNTDAGEAVLRPVMQALGWTYRGRVTWDKGTSKAEIGIDGMRTWQDVTEACGFYQREVVPFDEVFGALAVRMNTERQRVGVSRSEIDAVVGASNVSQYWWQAREWRCPTRPMWDVLQRISGGFGWDWADMKQEEQQARAEYEASRPAFNAPLGVSNVWRHNAVSGSERLRVNGEAHPCQKPLAFAKRAILASTRPGETVLDPFAGTSRCAVAVERMSDSDARKVVSIDIDRVWLDAVRSSLVLMPEETSTDAQPSLFGAPGARAAASGGAARGSSLPPSSRGMSPREVASAVKPQTAGSSWNCTPQRGSGDV